MSDSGLFSEFPPVTAKEWKQKIQFDLKGADYNDTLVWESNEGIKVKPFYHSEDLSENTSPQLKSSNSWKVGQTIYAGDARKANTKALDALQRGAESIIFNVPDTEVDFGTLLSQIDVSQIPLHFRFGFLDSNAIDNLYAPFGGKRTNFHLHIDPIGNLARSGNWHHDLQKDHEILETIGQQAAKYQTETWLGVDLSLYQNSGANAVQQLAYAIAHTNEYLNHFQKSNENGQGIPLAVNFTVAIGGNYFFEIAKLKALRWLWKTLNTAYSDDNRSHILALPSRRNKTLYDYNVNMLRTTSECMSAVLGGADTVCNLPYDALYHKDNEFG
ncbi:MAG: methylmalonyl-CoA mutase family protein, partial [Bacteroidota bacterium]